MIAAEFTNIDLLMVVGIFVMLLVLMFLAVAEMGLSRISRPRAASLADKGLKSGKALKRLVDEPERWVNALLLMVQVCQIVQTTLWAQLADRIAGGVGVAVGVVLNVIVFFVLAEAVPKTYAVMSPQRAALSTARATAALVAFPPLRWISNLLISLTNVIVKGKGLEQGPFVSEQELLGIVEVAAEDGVVEHEERELIESIIEFGDTIAREVMVPRPDMVVIEQTCTVTQALDVAIEHGYSRLPVMNTDEDDVLGLAYTKDLMRTEREGGGDRPVTDFLRSVHFVPENKPVNRLMREMQAQKYHLALVADEYGAIAGLITLEDCLEELVGEIVDEHDEEDAEVQRLADGDYLVDGAMAIGDLNDLLGIVLPDEEWDTVGGFVFGTLEHVPDVGESVVHDGWRFTAAEMDGRRIRQVKVTVEPDVGDSSAGRGRRERGVDARRREGGDDEGERHEQHTRRDEVRRPQAERRGDERTGQRAEGHPAGGEPAVDAVHPSEQVVGDQLLAQRHRDDREERGGHGLHGVHRYRDPDVREQADGRAGEHGQDGDSDERGPAPGAADHTATGDTGEHAAGADEREHWPEQSLVEAQSFQREQHQRRLRGAVREVADPGSDGDIAQQRVVPEPAHPGAQALPDGLAERPAEQHAAQRHARRRRGGRCRADWRRARRRRRSWLRRARTAARRRSRTTRCPAACPGRCSSRSPLRRSSRWPARAARRARSPG
jgi:CBS domain containing-hemolysin-like protein